MATPFTDEFFFFFNIYFCQAACVWKAKNTSLGSSTVITENHLTKPVLDAHPPDMGPGKSFRNFRFDTAAILRAMESGFPA